MEDEVIAGPSRMSRAAFEQVLVAAGSPAAPEAGAMYDALVAAGVRAEILLAFFRHESQYGKLGICHDYDTRNPGNVRSPEQPGAGAIIDTRGGPFTKYPTWAAGARDWAARLLGPKYAGSGLTTVRQVIPKYAPSSDNNQPASYIRAVLDSVTGWAAGGQPTTAPLAQPAIVSNPSPNRGYNNGFTHRPEAICWHITEGTNSLGWLRSPQSGASANYLIDRDGTIHELVPPTESAWANGRVQQPNTRNPLIAGWRQEGCNFNQRTVSIEHEGFSSHDKGGSLTAAQVASTVALTAWLCARFNIAPDETHIVRHADIDSVDRPNCPGFSPDERSAWIGQVARLVAAPMDKATLLKTTTEREVPFGYRGALIGEGEVLINDTWERLALYEKLTVHTLGDGVAALFVAGPTSLADLEKAQRIRRS
ncbi:MAG TPA: peptidoglycan recognition family protein [Thermomicrobiales bacterium]|nr:peptidoglycan recognition family protein [Thermomicrobiales bacterium]